MNRESIKRGESVAASITASYIERTAARAAEAQSRDTTPVQLLMRTKKAASSSQHGL